MKKYLVGLSVRVTDTTSDLRDEGCGSSHRITVPVEALSAEHAAQSFALALGVLVKQANTKPAEHATKGTGKP